MNMQDLSKHVKDIKMNYPTRYVRRTNLNMSNRYCYIIPIRPVISVVYGLSDSRATDTFSSIISKNSGLFFSYFVHIAPAT